MTIRLTADLTTVTDPENGGIIYFICWEKKSQSRIVTLAKF